MNLAYREHRHDEAACMVRTELYWRVQDKGSEMTKTETHCEMTSNRRCLFGGSCHLSSEMGSELILHSLLALIIGQFHHAPLIIVRAIRLLLLLERRVSANFLVSLDVQVLNIIGLNPVRNVLGKLPLVGILIFFEKVVHVLRHVNTENATLQLFRVKAFLLRVGREPLLVVRNVHTTVNGAFHRGEHLLTSGSASKADIQKGSKRALLIVLLNLVHLTAYLFDTLVELIETELREMTTSAEKTHAVSRGEVGEAVLDTIARKLVGIGGGENLVTLDTSGNNLADDVPE